MNAVGVGDFAQHPLGEHHLVGGIQGVHGQEFDLLLDHLATVGHEVTDLRVGVLDRASHGHQVQQGFRAHALPLREGARFVVPALRFDGEQVLLLGEEVVLEFAEGLQLAARLFLQGALSLAQNLLRRRGQGLTVDVVEAAQDIQGRNMREGVEEGRGQAGHDVQVRGGRLDEGEERRAVDALPQRQHTVQVSLGLDREVQRLQATISSDIAQVEHPDAVVLDIADDVGFRKFLRRLSEGSHEGVGTEGNGVGRQHEALLFEYDWVHVSVTIVDPLSKPDRREIIADFQ